MTEDTPDPDDLRERLDALGERLDAAAVEADYVDIEDEIETLEADVTALEEATDDEDELVEELADEVQDLAATLEEERGPYADDVTDILEGCIATIEGEEWTDVGRETVIESVQAFLEEEIDVLPDAAVGGDLGGASEAITAAIAVIDEASLDPDEDAGTIEALLEAAEALEATLEQAETWDDLSVREKLEVSGFYDILDHRKDYPPEWSAIKAHEQAGNVEMILLAIDLLDSEFIQENAMESLKRLGHPGSLDAVLELAERRDRDAIEVLGRIGDDEPVEMLCEFVEDGTNLPLELTILRSLGRIGSPEATQLLANRLVTDDPLIRSTAARALGMVGDTRAIEPLANVLAEDDSGNVRGSAAWALNEIGTEAALEVASRYADDREYLVEVQAGRAQTALDSTTA